ncbi:3-oxoacyl-ACP reductase [Nocardioides marmoribigeumensis]|uniref:3-oxoacyl-[acyl-carrier protein] reductase n=1 Tax=Nocardioides marmoribigeumensis TaxID=433649 RepID=A0ABU2BR52_9ACTN|nr:3-oxoacyl-ACP reductase [Nocardioides marmoribigeumensis]MDR7361127.1 3-oxoacyl-[acyl-carrier protein] reductase [Nocardioides marmoribigeumensis]
MSDRYQSLIHTPVGQLLAKNLGLPNPVELERYEEGQPLVQGTVVVGGSGRLGNQLTLALDELGVSFVQDVTEGETYKGLVFDATGLTSSEQLVELQHFFTPKLRKLDACARLVVIGTPPEKVKDQAEHVAQRALEGFTRSLGKEAGNGTTVQLVYVAPKADNGLASTLAFLLSPKSAYVSGQVIRVGAVGDAKATDKIEPVDWTKPLLGKTAVVTGASRGIGEQIARVLHRDGATVVGIDVPQAAEDLTRVMKDIDGDLLTLDITAKDAPARIAHHVATKHGGADIVVHNAGITRDKKLANMKDDVFASAIAVNLTAPERITKVMLEEGAINPNGRIVGVASIAGIAGNVGQTNYAASKAGVIGFVEALAPTLKDGITVNAVAPGFIETKMTAAVPFMTREVGRRLNAMQQGGQPVDVAEAIAYYASPASSAVNGNVVRVCGQMMLGA